MLLDKNHFCYCPFFLEVNMLQDLSSMTDKQLFAHSEYGVGRPALYQTLFLD